MVVVVNYRISFAGGDDYSELSNFDNVLGWVRGWASSHRSRTVMMVVGNLLLYMI